MRLKIGILGAGFMGNTHTRILSKDKRVKIVGIVDPDERRATTLAKSVGAKTYSGLEKLLTHIDALYVTTPNTKHVEPVLLALKKGVHVFSEKPMATSLSGAKKILAEVQKKKLIYQVGHNRRFAPVYKYMKSLIDKNKIVPYSTHVKMNRGELLNPPWVADASITGGFLYESTIHLLDLLRWLIGDVGSIQCVAKANVYEQLDDFTMLLTFKNGRCATLVSSAHAGWMFPFERIEIFGKHSTLLNEEMEKVIYSPGLNEEIVTKDYTQCSREDKWGYLEEDKCFIDSIVKGKPSAVSAEEGYRAVELVRACYQSARGEKLVRFPL